MDANEFERWLAAMSSLNIEQRRQAWQLLAPSAEPEINRGQICREPSLGRTTSNEEPAATPAAAQAAPLRLTGAEAIAELGQRRVEITGCPHCDYRDVVIWGNASGLTRYRCKACRRTFNALTKTPLARLRKKEKWGSQAEALIEGVIVSKAAARCDVHYTTAFRWRHRFLLSLSTDKPTSLSGIVESDETFVLEFFKGKRSDLPRPSAPAKGAENLASEGCPSSRYRSSLHETGLAPPPMPCCQD